MGKTKHQDDGDTGRDGLELPEYRWSETGHPADNMLRFFRSIFVLNNLDSKSGSIDRSQGIHTSPYRLSIGLPSTGASNAAVISGGFWFRDTGLIEAEQSANIRSDRQKGRTRDRELPVVRAFETHGIYEIPRRAAPLLTIVELSVTYSRPKRDSFSITEFGQTLEEDSDNVAHIKRSNKDDSIQSQYNPAYSLAVRNILNRTFEYLS